MAAVKHKHFFARNRKADDDVNGRFDAIEDDRGKAWVYIVAKDKWIPRKSYEDACAFAEMLAAWWTEDEA